MREEKQVENHDYAFLGGRADLKRRTRKRGPKPLEKPKGAANLQSPQTISISRACETKIGYVLSFLENAMSEIFQEFRGKSSVYSKDVFEKQFKVEGVFRSHFHFLLKKLLSFARVKFETKGNLEKNQISCKKLSLTFFF